MNVADAWKVGFLTRCSEEGLAEPQLCERIEKLAGFLDLLKALPGTAKGLLSGAGQATGMGLRAVPWLAGGALAGGGALGYLTAKATSDPETPDEARKQELLAEYRRMIARARVQQ